MPRESPKAVVLLSGGLDSATVLALARSRGFAAHALTVRYGQRHEAEVAAAVRVAFGQGVADHKIARVDLGLWGGSSLTAAEEVPKGRDAAAIGRGGIPRTYVPARNTVLLSLALAWAEVLGSRDIFIGVNAIDYSGYPDCRPEFIAAFERLAALGTRAGKEEDGWPRVHAPLISMGKAQIIRLGVELGVDHSQTLTCYDPGPEGAACGACDACVLRLKGFADAGLSDPAPYAAGVSREAVAR